MAQSSQRGQLLKVIDDLNSQLKNVKQQLPDAEFLKTAKETQRDLIQRLEQKENLIKDQAQQILVMQASIAQLSKTNQKTSEEIETLQS